HLYVNLRCMEVHESNQASLYAGAGIVKGSKAEEEWNETEAKMNTLLNMLH
ncbi:MAG: isochorismate synthase, partial [Bacteroidetes bacterium SW_10_40_5]